MSAFAAVIEPASRKLIELGKLKPGQHALDLGCGLGPIACWSAPSVEPGGRILGIDSSLEAIAAARTIARDLSNVELAAGRAESLDLPDASFDVVFCQLGLEFFEDAPRALREALRVLKPGGRMSILSFGTREKNEALTVPHDLLLEAGVVLAPIDALFAFGREGKLEGELRNAGFIEPKTKRLGAMLNVTAARGWWEVASSAAGWRVDAWDRIADRLTHIASRTIGGEPARFSLEMQLALAHREDPAKASARFKPKKLDAYLGAARRQVMDITTFEGKRLLRDKKKVVALDVRETADRKDGVIPGSIHIPRGALEERVEGLIPDRRMQLIVYSSTGRRSVLAAFTLQEMGYESVLSLAGGFAAWLRARNPTEPAKG